MHRHEPLSQTYEHQERSSLAHDNEKPSRRTAQRDYQHTGEKRSRCISNAIFSILVKSALDASAGKGTNEIIVVSSELNSGVNKGLESPFSNYLSWKRPNWECIDMNLFHKLTNIKSEAVWHTIMKNRADVRLNAIMNILVWSALNASAGKGTNEIIVV